MAKKISASVGKGGKNKPEDTKIVQELLNDFAKMCGFKKLDTDGLVGPKTISAIAEFQKTAVGMSRPDSRVDPSGDSFATLSKGPKKAESEIKKAEEAEKQKQAAADAKKAAKEAEDKQPGKPQVKGNIQGVDKKILAVLEAVSAHYSKPIYVEIGKQVAPAIGSAEELWQTWETKYKRGNRLGLAPQLQKKLDSLYNDVNKDGFVKEATKSLGNSTNGLAAAHESGHAVDIKRSTDSKVVAALSTILRYEVEGNVFHFDDKGKSIPKTIGEDIKKKWK